MAEEYRPPLPVTYQQPDQANLDSLSKQVESLKKEVNQLRAQLNRWR